MENMWIRSIRRIFEWADGGSIRSMDVSAIASEEEISDENHCYRRRRFYWKQLCTPYGEQDVYKRQLYAYNMGWSTKLIGRSSAVTVLLFIFLMVICGIYFAVINKWEREDSK